MSIFIINYSAYNVISIGIGKTTLHTGIFTILCMKLLLLISKTNQYLHIDDVQTQQTGTYFKDLSMTT